MKVCKSAMQEFLFAHQPCCQWGYTWMQCNHCKSG